MKKTIPVILIMLAFAVAAGFAYYRTTPQKPTIGPGGTVFTTAPTPVISPKDQQQVIAKDQQSHTLLTLTVLSPIHGSTVKSASLLIKGKTAPGADVFANETETTADQAGNFSVRLTLDEGENPIVVMANDANGNVAQQDLTITFDAGL
jgi:hypothetical protein